MSGYNSTPLKKNLALKVRVGFSSWHDLKKLHWVFSKFIVEFVGVIDTSSFMYVICSSLHFLSIVLILIITP